MNSILSLGKYLFAIPFAVFGVLHLMNAEAMKGLAYGQTFLVYLTGVALIAATVSMLIGKMDKLATVLLGIFLLITALAVHLPTVMGGDQGALGQILKDLSLAGGSWLYALHNAKDNSVIG